MATLSDDDQWDALLLEKLKEPGTVDDIVLEIVLGNVDLNRFFHSCGTPACLAGHMASMQKFSPLMGRYPAGKVYKILPGVGSLGKLYNIDEDTLTTKLFAPGHSGAESIGYDNMALRTRLCVELKTYDDFNNLLLLFGDAHRPDIPVNSNRFGVSLLAHFVLTVFRLCVVTKDTPDEVIAEAKRLISLKLTQVREIESESNKETTCATRN